MRSLPASSARQWVASAAKSNGIALDAAALEAAVAELTKTVAWDEAAGAYVAMDGPHRRSRVVEGRAEDLPTADHVFNTVFAHGKPTSRGRTATPQPSSPASMTAPGFNLTQAMIAEKQRLAGNSRPIPPEVLNAPNPWAKETFNLSRQCLIERSDPALAKRLEATASPKPVKEYT